METDPSPAALSTGEDDGRGAGTDTGDDPRRPPRYLSAGDAQATNTTRETRMAVEITGTYAGNLKVALRHGPSGAEMTTAAPVDNNGDGSSFSPTDLVAAALGACMVTLMGIAAQKHGFAFGECSFVVEKHMRADPRRIDALPVTLRMPAGLTAQQRRLVEHAALTCPVHRSLLPEIRRDVQFVYPDELSASDEDAPEAAATA